MAEVFQLEIVTPEKKVVETTAEEVQIPGKNGYLGILPGHAPLITELSVGEITFRENSSRNSLWRGDSQKFSPTRLRFSPRPQSVRPRLMSSAHARRKSAPSSVSPVATLRSMSIVPWTPSTAHKRVSM